MLGRAKRMFLWYGHEEAAYRSVEDDLFRITVRKVRQFSIALCFAVASFAGYITGGSRISELLEKRRLEHSEQDRLALLEQNKSYLQQAIQAREHLEEVQTSMEIAISSAEVMYFEYYPEKGIALEYNGRESFCAPQKMEDYPERWFRLGVTHPDDVPVLQKAFDALSAGAASYACEARNQIAGEYHWYRYSFTSVLDANNRRVKVACTAVDVTSQKRAQIVLEQQKNSLSKILENIAIGVYVFELSKDSCRIAVASPAICEMMGTDPRKTVGAHDQEVLSLTHPEDVPTIQKVIETLRKPGGAIDYEYRSRNKQTGAYLWLSAK